MENLVRLRKNALYLSLAATLFFFNLVLIFDYIELDTIYFKFFLVFSTLTTLIISFIYLSIRVYNFEKDNAFRITLLVILSLSYAFVMPTFFIENYAYKLISWYVFIATYLFITDAVLSGAFDIRKLLYRSLLIIIPLLSLVAHSYYVVSPEVPTYSVFVISQVFAYIFICVNINHLEKRIVNNLQKSGKMSFEEIEEYK